MTFTLKVPACQINILDSQTIFGINIVKTQFSSLFLPNHATDYNLQEITNNFNLWFILRIFKHPYPLVPTIYMHCPIKYQAYILS